MKTFKIIYSKFIEDDEYDSNHNWSLSGEFKNSRELLVFFNKCKNLNFQHNENIFDIDSCSYIELNERVIEKDKIHYYESTYKKFLESL